MKISIGSDHRGFIQKNVIMNQVDIADFPIEWNDVGCFSEQRCNYPEFAKLVTTSILEDDADFGILLCGSGIGMSIAANRFPGIYAGLAWNEAVAVKGREDDNVNVLVLPSDFITDTEAVAIVNAWLTATFKGGVYLKRIQMLDEI